MEQLLHELLDKVYRMMETQQRIIERLDKSITYPKIQEKKKAAKTKKEEEKKAIEEYKQLNYSRPQN